MTKPAIKPFTASIIRANDILEVVSRKHSPPCTILACGSTMQSQVKLYLTQSLVNYGCLAQLGERQTEDLKVGCSIHPRPILLYVVLPVCWSRVHDICMRIILIASYLGNTLCVVSVLREYLIQIKNCFPIYGTPNIKTRLTRI
eukprot:NODE_257_length_12663_cov_0.723655.p9 type:complete len:144 gc:universal NODE_257_length_12663_cov_0.723655:9671-9240(-)